MATNFPTGLDSLTNPTASDPLNSPSHADQHGNVNDAVEALEAKVGVDGSAVTSSLDYKVAGLAGKQYVTLASDSQLSSERVLTAGTGITVTDAGAGSTVTVATSAVLPTVVDAKGDLLVGTANDTVARLAVGGTNGHVLKVDSAQTAGVKWAAEGGIQESLIDAKGDLIVGSAADTAARLAVGSNGDMLVADSGATAGVRWQGQTNTGRNFVINGAMQVAQRGTSTASITTSGYYTADRWQVEMSSLGTWTQSVETDGPTGSGLAKSLKMLCTTADASPAAADYLFATYNCEGQDLQRVKKGTSSAEQLTLSFWVKSNVTGTYIAELYDNDNSRQVSASYTVSSSATWEKKTITFPADTTGAFDNDNALSLLVHFFLGAGTNRTSGTLNTVWNSITAANRGVGQTNLAAATNNYWQITGVQLEVGAVATGFDFEPLERTLSRCYRYYYRFGARSLNAAETYGIGSCYSTSQALVTVSVPVELRAAAVSIDFNQLTLDMAGTDDDVTSMTINQAGTKVILLFPSVAGTPLVQYRPVFIRNNNTAAGYLGISAEL